MLEGEGREGAVLAGRVPRVRGVVPAVVVVVVVAAALQLAVAVAAVAVAAAALAALAAGSFSGRSME